MAFDASDRGTGDSPEAGARRGSSGRDQHATNGDLLAAILHGAAEAVVVVDEALNISLFNRGAERIFGYSAEEVAGAPLNSLLPARFRDRHEAAIRAFQEAPEGARFMGQRGEIVGLRKDGTEFPAEASIVRLSDGHQHRFAAILRDVSEKHEAAQALRRSEETHRQLADLLGTVLDALPAHIAVLDEAGTILRVNEPWARFAMKNGYEKPGFGVGHNYLDVCEATAGPSAEKTKEIGQSLKQVLSGQSLGFVRDYACHGPGISRWFQMLVASTMDAAGTGAVVMHVDVTERKLATATLKAERHLLALIASDQPLRETLDELCGTIERQVSGSICTILAVEGAPRRLKFLAGRNLPASLRERMSDLLVDEAPFPCCEAVRTNKDVWIPDVALEERWRPFREMVLAAGLQSCWSVPIAGSSGQPVAVFAIYQAMPDGADVGLRRALQRTTHIAGIAIERKSAQQALRESEERYALAFQGANDGLWDWDMRTNLVYRSPRYLEIIGRPAGANGVTRVSSRDWLLALVHPDDLTRSLDAVNRHLRGETSFFEAEYRFRLPNGEYRWLFDRGLALRDTAGRPYRMAGSITDVTARKQTEEIIRQSEERLRRIARNMPGAIFEQRRRRDGTTVFPYVSEGIYRLMGSAIDLADLAGRGDAGLDLVHPDDRERVRQATELSAKTLQPLKIEWRTIDRGGGSRWVQTISEPRLLPDGDVVWEGVLIDVTEQKLADEQRQLLENQLRQAQKAEALGTLAGGIAHDINNTLVPIIGLTELAVDAVPAAGALHENLEQILQGGQRIRDLVKQILAFSRREKPERKPVDLRCAVAETTRLLRATIPATISLRVELGDDALPVYADATQLHQVIMNLVSNASSAIGSRIGWMTMDLTGNASSATGPKTGWIEIKLGRVEIGLGDILTASGLLPGRYGKLTVVDSGDGIPPHVIDRIFDPFFTTKPVGEGTGLGLSVVQGIVKSHGGLIAVESLPGRGARFDVFLPLIGNAVDR